MNRKKFILIILILSNVLFLGFISIISPIIPISYDEAWNWTNIASKGHLYSILNYPAANNHVFFTFLQSFITPKFLLWYFPEATRLLNVFVDVSFFLVVWWIFSKFFKNESPLWFVVIFFICFFTSPLSTMFFIIARGYLLGGLLLLLGLFFLEKRKYFFASAFLYFLSGQFLHTYTVCP